MLYQDLASHYIGEMTDDQIHRLFDYISITELGKQFNVTVIDFYEFEIENGEMTHDTFIERNKIRQMT